jgi:hypothetical protein
MDVHTPRSLDEMQSSLRVALLSSDLSPDFATEGRSRQDSLRHRDWLSRHSERLRDPLHDRRAFDRGPCERRATRAPPRRARDLNASARPGDRRGGYLIYGPEAANVLYHVVNDRHLHTRPMVFTTNKPLNAWGRVLHDSDMAAAILDRALERGRWITLDEPSGRTKHIKLETAVPQDAGGAAEVSGEPVPEFPEPTLGHVHCDRRILLLGLLLPIRGSGLRRDFGTLRCRRSRGRSPFHQSLFSPMIPARSRRRLVLGFAPLRSRTPLGDRLRQFGVRGPSPVYAGGHFGRSLNQQARGHRAPAG